MVDFIVVDDMIVTPEKDRAVRKVMNEIMGGSQANAGEGHRRDVTLRPSAQALEVAVFHEVPAGRERLSIASG